jgi:lauroyl/myristoyl acyltransferase
MRLLKAKAITHVALIMKSLAIRLTGLFIRIMPFEAFFLNSLGLVLGLSLMVLRIGHWGEIIRFARHIENHQPDHIFLMKYFAQQGKDGVWGYAYCEAPAVLEQYVTTGNAEALRNALSAGKGAIVIGAHYGPTLYTYLFYRMHFNVKALLAKEYVMSLQNAGTLVPRPFRNKKIMFMNDSGVVLISREEEKHFVSHVRKGGLVVTHLDFPGPTSKEKAIRFFGLSICPHVFPFRLALKYNIPVFFCLFRNMRHGGYQLDFIPSGHYATPEEGFKRYLSYLQGRIEENPFMWSMIPRFFQWS